MSTNPVDLADVFHGVFSKNEMVEFYKNTESRQKEKVEVCGYLLKSDVIRHAVSHCG